MTLLQGLLTRLLAERVKQEQNDRERTEEKEARDDRKGFTL